jgi:hypothetical protein
MSKKLINYCQLMSYNMMIGYDIYDRFTMEHFPLCQIMILTTRFLDLGSNDITFNTEIYYQYQPYIQ